jgi:hypothetical protein
MLVLASISLSEILSPSAREKSTISSIAPELLSLTLLNAKRSSPAPPGSDRHG